jgi:uncharacterized protein YndB with AHSA1/START domain
MTSDSTGTGTEEQGPAVQRVFDASPELVWQACTEPEHFKRWYGPAGMSLDVCEIDFRVGGSHLFGMRMPDGGSYFTAGVYREITPFERFVYTDAMADEHGAVAPAAEGGMETVVTVELEDLGDGKTRLTLRQVGWPDPEMGVHANVGWSQALDKLAETLAAA